MHTPTHPKPTHQSRTHPLNILKIEAQIVIRLRTSLFLFLFVIVTFILAFIVLIDGNEMLDMPG